MHMNDIIHSAQKNECSDIHITVGTGITVRQYGKLMRLNTDLTDQDLECMIMEIVDDEKRAYFAAGNDLDFAHQTNLGTRARVNVYRNKGNIAACLRIMGSTIPKLEEMNLPKQTLANIAANPRGLVLVTGPTGSGKSTTLAAMIDYINRTRSEHILTIEDPIEFVYTEDKSVIHQREIGTDVTDFSVALRSALREDPDIILLGEMRDYETIAAAVTAAETGHLVFGTLHTISAAESIARIIDVFPPHSQNQIRTQLASVLKAVISQTLIPIAEGNGRVAATEILLGIDAVGNLIRQDKAHQIDTIMQSNAAIGMHTLNSDLERLVRERIITKETAVRVSSNPTALRC